MHLHSLMAASPFKLLETRQQQKWALKTLTYHAAIKVHVDIEIINSSDKHMAFPLYLTAIRKRSSITSMSNKVQSSEGFCLNVNYSHWSASFYSCHQLWPLIQNYSSLIFKSRRLSERPAWGRWGSCMNTSFLFSNKRQLFVSSVLTPGSNSVFFLPDSLHCIVSSYMHYMQAHKEKGSTRSCLESKVTWEEMW